MKRLGLLISLIMIVSLLAACGPKATPSPTEAPPAAAEATPTSPPEPTPTSPPPAPEPVTLRMSIAAEPPTLDPNLGEDTTSIDCDKQLFMGLLKINGKTSELEKELATDWEVSASSTVNWLY